MFHCEIKVEITLLSNVKISSCSPQRLVDADKYFIYAIYMAL